MGNRSGARARAIALGAALAFASASSALGQTANGARDDRAGAGAPAADGRPLDRVKLQLGFTAQFQFAGVFAALDRGFYADEGLAVEIREDRRPEESPIDALLSGSAEFATCESEIVVARAEGKPVVVLACIFQHSAFCVVARRDAGISQPSDLVGKRISLAHERREAELLAMLQREGITAGRYIAVPQTWNVKDVIERRVDALLAYVTNEPDQMRSRGVEPSVILPINYGIDFYGDCLCTTEEQVHDHPERVAAFRRATLRGWDYALEHPDELVELLYTKHGCRERGLSREHLRAEAEAVRRLMVWKLVETGHVNPGRWQRIADTYAELGLSPRLHSLEGFMYDPDAHADGRAWVRWFAASVLLSSLLVSAALLWAGRLRALVGARTRELRASEERFRQVFQNASIGCVLTTIHGKFLQVNPAICSLLGYTADELVGHHFNEFTHPEDHGLGSEKQNRIEKGKLSVESYEKRYVRRDGRTILCEIGLSVVRDEAGEPLYVIAQILDLTARRAAEEALRESETRFRAMADDAPVMIWTMRADGRYDFFSQTWLAFTGRTLEAELGSGWAERVHPADRERCIAEHAAALETRRAFEVEYRLRRADGEWRWILEKGSPRVLGDKTFAGFVGSCVDVSDRKHLEEQLRQSQKMEAIGRLAGGVAHDFNNLLAVVQGYTDLLLAQTARGDHRRPHVEQIASAVEHAASLTRQLLAFSRKHFLHPSVIELDSVVGDMNALLRRIIGEDVKLATLCSNAGRVKVDRAQFEQVILNLAVNARDAMPRGGTLTIETLALEVSESAPRPPLAPGQWAELLVRDTGIGMDEKTLARIFEPFFTTKERGKGTGLGLSMVYGIVAQSGGHIEVESEPGHGATFHVFLPRVEEPPTPSSAQVATDAPRGTETILLVEDDARVRKTAEAMLRTLGYRVLVAADGPEALASLTAPGERVQLLLTDVVMPGMNGPDLARRVLAARGDTAVLFMSGYMDDRSVPQGGLEPGTAFLQKPFSLAGLAQAVRQVLDARRPAAEPARASGATTTS